jgi:hypothetical protein
MDATWWPDLLRHVGREDPWADPMVTVAEILSFEGPVDGQRFSSTALIAPADLKRLNGQLSSFGVDVDVNGPHPSRAKRADTDQTSGSRPGSRTNVSSLNLSF